MTLATTLSTVQKKTNSLCWFNISIDIYRFIGYECNYDRNYIER